MPKRKPGWVPALTHVKSRGQGRVRVPGRPDVYLGPAGCWPADQKRPPRVVEDEYGLAVSEWLAGKSAARSAAPASRWTCADVANEYLASLRGRTGHSDGSAQSAMRVLLSERFVRMPASQFTAELFAEAREWFLATGARASTVNTYARMIRAAFRWAAKPPRRAVPATVVADLALVDSLVDEQESPVRPADPELVEKVIAVAPPALGAVVRILALTGMRPGEALQMTPADIDRNADPDLWLYRPTRYKTMRHASVRKAGGRRVWLGPQAQEVLTPWLALRQPDEAVFQNRVRKPFTVRAFWLAVITVCKRHHLPRLQPRQLRHNALTGIEASFTNIDHAQAVAGHTRPDMTRRYSHAQDLLARQAMKRLG